MTLPKCSDDPGNSGGTDFFFVDVPTINFMKEVFFSQIQLETNSHRSNNLASHRRICKALLLF